MGPFFSPRAPGSETARLAVRSRQRIVGAPNCVSRQFTKLPLLLLILFSSAFLSAPPVLAQTSTSSPKRVFIRRNSDQPKLPANAIVQFEPPTLWALDGWYFILFAAGFLIQTFLVVWLLITRAERRREAEVETGQLAEARRLSEERNRAILEAVPDLMFLQTLDGVYVDYHVRDKD